MNRFFSFFGAGLLVLQACTPTSSSSEPATTSAETEAPASTLLYPQEKHLANVQQLTFGGDNAEGYFSFDDQYLTFQRSHPSEDIPCDQIYYGKLPTKQGDPFEMELVSTGDGRTTCSFFMPGDEQIIYASTHTADVACPPTPDREKIRKYVWPIYASFELFISDREGKVVKQLTDNEFYDAEATLSPTKDKIVFTSTRNGDLDLYTMEVDGSNIKQITFGLGYDGGAFFSPDGKELIFRASRPQTPEAQQEYKDLLAQGLVAPSDMELYICDVDGGNLRQITQLGKANWAPYFHPDGKRIIFSSNHTSESGRLFNLFMINRDGTGLEQITYGEEFESFAMFSYSGKKLIFASNRNNGGTRDTNLFYADWVD